MLRNLLLSPGMYDSASRLASLPLKDQDESTPRLHHGHAF